jgi:threonine dehydratase
MYESVRAGRPLTLAEEPTLAEALAGGIGAPNRYTLALVRELVDGHLLVSEEEIAAAMRHALTSLKLVVEGGGAVALAAALFHSRELGKVPGATAVLLSGGNVSLDRLAEAAGGSP